MNNGMNAPANPRGVGVLESELHQNASGLSELASAIDALEKSMCNVLRPDIAPPPAPHAPGQGLTSVHVEPSPLVVEARQQQARITGLIGRVQSLQNRLEA